MHAPFIFDDYGYVVNNPLLNVGTIIKTDQGLTREQQTVIQVMKSRPLTFLSLYLNRKFTESSPGGYHFFNVLLHAINSVLIFLLTSILVRILFSDLKINRYIGFACAILFVVHPVNTEVVSYISHRSESLVTLFCFLTILFFINYSIKQKFNLQFYMLSLLSFVLALLSKETSIIIPALILLIDYVFFCDLKFPKLLHRARYHAPYWTLMLVSFFVRHFFVNQYAGVIILETNEKWTMSSYLATQVVVIFRYIKLLLLPFGQSIDHDIKPIIQVFTLTYGLSVLSLVLILVSPYILYRTYSHSLTEENDRSIYKLQLFSIVWFFISITPTSSFIPLTEAMAERRVYTSFFGFSLFLMSIYLIASTRLGLGGKAIIKTLFVLFIVFLSLKMYKRNILFNDPMLLWEECLSAYPENARAHNNLGNLLFEKGRYDEAFSHYQKVADTSTWFPEVFANIANIYLQKGSFEKAIEFYLKALEKSPNSAQIMNNLGVAYYKIGEYKRAVELYTKSLASDPQNPQTLTNLGDVNYMMKHYVDALMFYKRALGYNPRNGLIYENLGNTFYALRQDSEALRMFLEAKRLMPKNIGLMEKIRLLGGSL